MSTLMLNGDHEQWVINMIAKMTGLPHDRISPDSRLNHDLGMTGDDAAEFLSAYSEAFGVDMSAFRFSDHFTGEPHLFNWWLTGRASRLTPITVRDLVEAAKQKKWITPRSAPPDSTHDP